MVDESNKGISANEIALYDRQIRLWGLAAQERMRSANVLLITIGGFANEVAKNIVLAGIGSLTIIDSRTVAATDLAAQFFVTEESIGKNRAEACLENIEKLNRRVTVKALAEDFRSKDDNFYAPFDVIVASELTFEEYLSINEICHSLNKPFYAAGLIGLYGYVFVDLCRHRFIIEREKSNISAKIGPETSSRSIVDIKTVREGVTSKEVITKEENYNKLSDSVKNATSVFRGLRSRALLKVSPVLPAVLAMWDDADKGSTSFHELVLEKCRSLGLPVGIISDQFTTSFENSMPTTELSPVAAVLGGIVAQDILNYLAAKEQPIQNWVFLDGDTFSSPIYCI
ncbi:hypothetical protein V1511DRAFT_497210 [Dipodascopsis uninucleata]